MLPAVFRIRLLHKWYKMCWLFGPCDCSSAPAQLKTALLEEQMRNHESESIHVTRVLSGPAESVFEAWINPALSQQWLAPKAQVDAREGGHFRLEVPKPEGTHVVTGRFQEFK